MSEQHRRVRDLGYSYIRTHTENKYRSMLVLNIKTGFDIIGVYKSATSNEQKIMLEMEL